MTQSKPVAKETYFLVDEILPKNRRIYFFADKKNREGNFDVR